MDGRTYSLIQYLIDRRDYPVAEKMVTEALEEGKADQHLLFFKGLLEKAKGEIDASIMTWRQALVYNVNNTDVLMNLGIALCERGSAAKGLSYLNRYCRLKSSGVDEICRIVDCMKRSGLYEEAIRFVMSQSQTVKESLKVAFALGRLYFEVGQFEVAMDYFKRALGDKELNAEASNLLCYIYESLYNGNALVREIESLIAKTLDRTDLYFNLGMILSEQEDYDSSIRYLYDAYQLDPSDPSLKDALDEVCERKVDAVIRTNPDLLDEMGWLRMLVAYLHLGDWSSARMCLSKARQLNPKISFEDVRDRLGLQEDLGYLAQRIRLAFSPPRRQLRGRGSKTVRGIDVASSVDTDTIPQRETPKKN